MAFAIPGKTEGLAPKIFYKRNNAQDKCDEYKNEKYAEHAIARHHFRLSFKFFLKIGTLSDNVKRSGPETVQFGDRVFPSYTAK